MRVDAPEFVHYSDFAIVECQNSSLLLLIEMIEKGLMRHVINFEINLFSFMLINKIYPIH
jgi:hypothetical protein